MKRIELLRNAGVVKVSKDRFQVPGYKRSYSEKEAAERVAKDYGAKNYKDLQNAQRLKKFKSYERRQEQGKLPKDKGFFKDFFDLRKAKYKGKVAKRIYSKQSVAMGQQRISTYRQGESP
jgi:hypothetical protein